MDNWIRHLIEHACLVGPARAFASKLRVAVGQDRVREPRTARFQGGYAGYCVVFPPARRAGVGGRDDLGRQASRALALGPLGEAVRAPARQAQPGRPRGAPGHRHRSTPPPIAPSITRAHRLSPHAHDAPTGAPASMLRPAVLAVRKGFPAAQRRCAPLRSTHFHLKSGVFAILRAGCSQSARSRSANTATTSSR